MVQMSKCLDASQSIKWHFVNIVFLQSLVFKRSSESALKIMKIDFGISQINVYTGPFVFVPSSTFSYLSTQKLFKWFICHLNIYITADIINTSINKTTYSECRQAGATVHWIILLNPVTLFTTRERNDVC